LSALFEQAQDFGLARRQVRMRRRRHSIFLHASDLAENPDHAVAALKRHGAHLIRDALPFRRQRDTSVVGAMRRPEQVTDEDFPASASLLGRKN
jgi:hypothetical protein